MIRTFKLDLLLHQILYLIRSSLFKLNFILKKYYLCDRGFPRPSAAGHRLFELRKQI